MEFGIANALALLAAISCAGAQKPLERRAPMSDAAAEHYWPRGQALQHPVVRDGKVEEYAQIAPALDEAEKAFHEQRWDDAEAAYARALEQCPTCYSAMTGRGDVEINRKGDLAGALQLYERALELNPSDPQTHVFRASALFRLLKPREAIQELVQALTLRPGYPFALMIALEAHRL